MQYLIAINEQGWEPAKATTLALALGEASRRLRGAYRDDVITVAVLHKDGQVQPVARRANTPSYAWRTI